MLEVESSEIWRITDRFVLHKFDEEMCWLFDIQEGDYFELNPVSYFIISCFDGKTPFCEIRRQVLSNYPEASPQRVCEDLQELLKKLVEERVLEPCNERRGNNEG